MSSDAAMPSDAAKSPSTQSELERRMLQGCQIPLGFCCARCPPCSERVRGCPEAPSLHHALSSTRRHGSGSAGRQKSPALWFMVGACWIRLTLLCTSAVSSPARSLVSTHNALGRGGGSISHRSAWYVGYGLCRAGPGPSYVGKLQDPV